MGSILRSEEMMLLQLLLQSDSAYACVRELGEVVSYSHFMYILFFCVELWGREVAHISNKSSGRVVDVFLTCLALLLYLFFFNLRVKWNSKT